ncbi:MAG TPA: glycoside hydrolase family 15 protein [Candidatus Bathyarchaeia archaeon]|jgi:GH15 family glucan-1,4-alpha-glucosidase|nr:glycoside hydrolase family 15 protein [Candidatus Bathyarchaeia archaeon]
MALISELRRVGVGLGFLSDRPVSPAGYKPISDYGVIGDMHSAALVGLDGSIDWYCAPRFDSPSVFAALLDSQKGGRFQLSPTGDFTSTQNYEGDTNVLVTTFRSTTGQFKVTDFMPCFMEEGQLKSFQEVHRIIDWLDGDPGLRVAFQPRFDYARGTTTIVESRDGCLAKNQRHHSSLASSVKLFVKDPELLINDFRLSKGQRIVLVLKWGNSSPHPVGRYETSRKLSKTLSYWKRWVSHVKYQGPYRSHVIRSCLVLKLLQYAPTGAMVAAVTTSLPESIGALRNWDYRYSWIRDTALSVWALSEAGASREALDYTRWMVNVRRHSKEKLQIMMGIGGEREIPELILDHLEGYRGSSPVRIGNAAYRQVQLDIYGILADSMHYLHRALGWTSKEVYENLVKYSADQAVAEWEKPDSGIWEMRQARPFVESKMWCYVALDRAIKIARELGYDEDWRRWDPVKKKIKNRILADGWSPKKKSFTMVLGGDELDAANLLMPLVGFLPAKDPKMASTIRHIREELSKDDLVYRYSVDDGQLGKEGAFTVCSFWMVDCLIRLEKLSEAEGLLNQLLKRGNHLGLFSEEIDPASGEALGNFPQAYTHMGLITAAVRLEEARRKTGIMRYARALSSKISEASDRVR